MGLVSQPGLLSAFSSQYVLLLVFMLCFVVIADQSMIACGAMYIAAASPTLISPPSGPFLSSLPWCTPESSAPAGATLEDVNLSVLQEINFNDGQFPSSVS
jgi:hypothetical protein